MFRAFINSDGIDKFNIRNKSMDFGGLNQILVTSMSLITRLTMIVYLNDLKQTKRRIKTIHEQSQSELNRYWRNVHRNKDSISNHSEKRKVMLVKKKLPICFPTPGMQPCSLCLTKVHPWWKHWCSMYWTWPRVANGIAIFRFQWL